MIQTPSGMIEARRHRCDEDEGRGEACAAAGVAAPGKTIGINMKHPQRANNICWSKQADGRVRGQKAC
jgi:hypothetical protein